MTSFTTKCITPVLCCLYPGNLRCVKFDSMLSRLSPTKGVPGHPRGSHWRQIPHPASSSSRNFKNALYYLFIHTSQLPQHFIFSRLPTFFAPISPSSLLFQANSPFTLFCTSGRKNVLRKLLRIPYRRLKAGFSVWWLAPGLAVLTVFVCEMHEVRKFAPCRGL